MSPALSYKSGEHALIFERGRRGNKRAARTVGDASCRVIASFTLICSIFVTESGGADNIASRQFKRDAEKRKGKEGGNRGSYRSIIFYGTRVISAVTRRPTSNRSNEANLQPPATTTTPTLQGKGIESLRCEAPGDKTRRKKKLVVSWCFEPSQPQRITYIRAEVKGKERGGGESAPTQ